MPSENNCRRHCARIERLPWRRRSANVVGAIVGALLVGVGSSGCDEPTGAKAKVQFDPAPQGIVFAATYSHDGRQIALACEDKSVAVHDAKTGTLVRRLEGHTERVWIAVFSPDGKSLASCSGEYAAPQQGGSVKVWDLETGKERHHLEGHKGLVFNVAFSPDGTSLLSAGWDGLVNVWDATTGKKKATLTDHSGPVRTIVFAPDGKTFATASFDGTVRLWDAANLKNVATLNAHSQGVQCLSFSPNGNYLATCGRPTGNPPDDEIVLWNVATGKEQGRIGGHRGNILCLSFSHDGKMLASCGGRFAEYGEVKLYEVASGMVRSTFSDHREWVECVRFSPDGKTLISAGGYRRGIPGQVIVRSLPELLEKKPEGKISAAQLGTLWTTIGKPDAADAYQAVMTMVAAPGSVPAFLKERVKPSTTKVDEKRVAKLVVDLDSNIFRERQRASKELDEMRELAGPLLRKVLDSKPPPEVEKRIAGLLKQYEVPTIGTELLRALRSIEILESIGDSEARQVLEALAKGIPDALITREAQASLRRMPK